ncbi:type I toxin-antitoxin system Fst family toxin [Listeria ilorinensis]|nr:type I toxin-antitoxin system Fst family toxin [Listeria ilorinensis]
MWILLFSSLIAPIVVGIILATYKHWLDNRRKNLNK